MCIRDRDGGELVEAGTEVGNKSDHTLYAHWTLTKVFSVTVPAGLPLAVTEDGVVTSSTDAAIANNSTCDVRVTGISLRTENGWTLVPFESVSYTHLDVYKRQPHMRWPLVRVFLQHLSKKARNY